MRIFLVLLGMIFATPAAASEAVLAFRNPATLAGLSDAVFEERVQSIVATCTYETQKAVVHAGGIERLAQTRLFRSCLSAQGVEVFSASEFRLFADSWNARNPKAKARGYATTID